MTTEPSIQAEPPQTPPDSDGGATGVLRGILARRDAARHGGSMPPAAAIRPQQTPQRAVATALGRAAQNACNMPLVPIEIALSGMTLAELPEYTPENAVLLVLEAGPDQLGVAVLDPSLVAALIESEVMGRVSSTPLVARRPTATDAAMAAAFINAALAELQAELSDSDDRLSIEAYRYASFVDDPRPLALMLEDCGYLAIRASLRLGNGGAREGGLMMMLPQQPGARAIKPKTHRQDEGAAQAGSTLSETAASPVPAGALRAAVMACPINLQAILCRRQISLRELRQLAPGSTLSLRADAIESASLETLDGRQLALGKLGELDGLRALRLRRVSAGSDDAKGAVPSVAAQDGPALPDMGMGGLDAPESGFAMGLDDESEAGFDLPDIGTADTSAIGANDADWPTQDLTDITTPEEGEDDQDTENVFADWGLEDSAEAATAEPPMDDIAAPDAFRQDDDSDSDAESPGLLDLNKPLDFGDIAV